MSYRDPHAMLECLFYVNELPGGEAHHDGGMKGRDHAAALANPMLQLSADETGGARSPAAAAEADGRVRRRGRRRDRRTWCSSSADVAGDRVARHRQAGDARAPARKPRTPRSRRSIASQCFFVSCDLNPSTTTRQGRRARAARTLDRDEHPGAGRDADDQRPVVRRRPSAAQRLRDVCGVHGRHRARGLRVLALPAQPQRRRTKASTS